MKNENTVIYKWQQLVTSILHYSSYDLKRDEQCDILHLETSVYALSSTSVQPITTQKMLVYIEIMYDI